LAAASRAALVRVNVKAAGVRLDSAVMSRIDQVLGGVAERDPSRTGSPPGRPWADRAAIGPPDAPLSLASLGDLGL